MMKKLFVKKLSASEKGYDTGLASYAMFGVIEKYISILRLPRLQI